MSPIETGLFSPRYAALPPIFYRVVAPQPLDAPHWAAISPDCAQLLGLNPATDFNDASLAVLAGQRPPAAHPALATAYSGHQFGVWAGQLGDGRALLLGERQGRDGQRYEVQIKGGGLTPFSRMGDGRAVLRSSIREFLCSEAMAGLGIPTSRALALVASRTPVQRESWETAAVVTRVAPSFVRFGMFEHFCHGNRPDALRQLADHVIAAHFAHCRDAPQPYLAWFTEVIAASARLAADWQAVGFCHGVLNTDNMNITGESFDYGPWRFLPAWDMQFTAAYFDQTGLYAFARQPEAVFWNLTQLASCLAVVSEPKPLADALNGFGPAYIRELRAAFLMRLGVHSLGEAADQRLVDTTLALLREGGAALRWEPLFFDWFGGFASSARALSGPRARLYQGEAFDAFRFALMEHEPDRIDRLEHPMFAAREPEEMLIEEVEAIWSAIAAADDWGPFHAKLARLEAARTAWGFMA